MSNLSVRVILDSEMEEVLGWKCVSLQDMNFEIHVKNNGQTPVRIKSEIELCGQDLSDRIGYLYPHGVHKIGPGESLAFYCSYDSEIGRGFSEVIIEDAEDKRFRAPITGRLEECESLD